MNAPILKYFLDRDLPDGPEKSAGLLEAKDCFVRAALDIRQEGV